MIFSGMRHEVRAAVIDLVACGLARAEVGHTHERFLYSTRDFGFITGAETPLRDARGLICRA